ERSRQRKLVTGHACESCQGQERERDPYASNRYPALEGALSSKPKPKPRFDRTRNLIIPVAKCPMGVLKRQEYEVCLHEEQSRPKLDQKHGSIRRLDPEQVIRYSSPNQQGDHSCGCQSRQTVSDQHVTSDPN